MCVQSCLAKCQGLLLWENGEQLCASGTRGPGSRGSIRGPCWVAGEGRAGRGPEPCTREGAAEKERWAISGPGPPGSVCKRSAWGDIVLMSAGVKSLGPALLLLLFFCTFFRWGESEMLTGNSGFLLRGCSVFSWDAGGVDSLRCQYSV